MKDRLYRNTVNGYIGGVCQGLYEWSGVPAILWRVAFLFIIPFAFWAYIILWIFVPERYY
jgi:phage shock protein PspC (stress-responsive transcriptional regulator)